ncbi:hypothetical protein CN221_14740 [Sinorhizobium meliloti]|uniref:hypothetical protein n=1 Tax=Rhizobium meliloti TaxID=382 RepID=UPI000FE0CADA|nr:hypothetical protein [Sinorhizobium meliloti]RVG94832.1 hypothetical protein CN221_14740 [Sinorhizobium meliloti]RVH65460.1 hypothetical protein CN209_12685 [Sinorhizobium meliloti]
MSTTTITIDTRVALSEESALVDHYRNRTLVLAQNLFERDVKVAELESQVAEMRATIEAQTADLAALQPLAETSDGEE